MTWKKLSRVILFLLGVSLTLAGCSQSQTAQPVEPINLATRSAAATAQAEVNALQNEAFELEEELDSNFSDHYVGMQVESFPTVKVIIYLTGASKEDLTQFVDDTKLMEVIEVREENISRKALRETRESFKAEMDKTGLKYTTALMMEPARLEVYVLDILGTRAMLSTRDVLIPENVEFVQKESLPVGG